MRSIALPRPYRSLLPPYLGHLARTCRTFALLVRLRYKAQMMYPASYYSYLTSKLLSYMSDYAVILVLMHRFESLAGWTLYEVLLLHSITITSYTFASSFSRHIALNVGRLVTSGEMDGVLLKPVGSLVWLTGYFYSPTYLSQTILGVVVFFISASALGITWSLASLGAALGILLCASLLQFALFLIASSTAFWTIRSRSIYDVLTAMQGLTSYPISIYGTGVRLLLTFIIPVAFINYYPIGLLLARPEHADVRLLVVLSPVVCVAMFVVSLLVWNRAVRSYSGSGS